MTDTLCQRISCLSIIQTKGSQPSQEKWASDDDYALKVNLRAPLAGSVNVPERIAGVPVRFEVVGPIRKRTP